MERWRTERILRPTPWPLLPEQKRYQRLVYLLDTQVHFKLVPWTTAFSSVEHTIELGMFRFVLTCPFGRLDFCYRAAPMFNFGLLITLTPQTAAIVPSIMFVTSWPRGSWSTMPFSLQQYTRGNHYLSNNNNMLPGQLFLYLQQFLWQSNTKSQWQKVH